MTNVQIFCLSNYRHRAKHTWSLMLHVPDTLDTNCYSKNTGAQPTEELQIFRGMNKSSLHLCLGTHNIIMNF